MSRADEVIERLQAEIEVWKDRAHREAMLVAKRDTRIVELESDRARWERIAQDLWDKDAASFGAALKAQPSAGVVLPEREEEIVAEAYDASSSYDEGRADGWNACLKEVARLNPPSECVAATEPYPVVCGYACVSLDKKGDLHIVVDSTERLATARAEHWRGKGYVSAVKPVTVQSGALAQQGKAVGDE